MRGADGREAFEFLASLPLVLLILILAAIAAYAV
jgi:hypothetical protein